MFGQVSEEAATVGIDNGGGRAAVEEVVVSGREAAEVGGDEGQVQKEDGEEEGEVWERNRHGKRFVRRTQRMDTSCDTVWQWKA